MDGPIIAHSPVFHYVDLKSSEVKDGSILNVHVYSEEEDVCGIVSIQKSGGPVWDDEANIRDRLNLEQPVC